MNPETGKSGRVGFEVKDGKKTRVFRSNQTKTVTASKKKKSVDQTEKTKTDK